MGFSGQLDFFLIWDFRKTEKYVKDVTICFFSDLEKKHFKILNLCGSRHSKCLFILLKVYSTNPTKITFLLPLVQGRQLSL